MKSISKSFPVFKTLGGLLLLSFLGGCSRGESMAPASYAIDPASAMGAHLSRAESSQGLLQDGILAGEQEEYTEEPAGAPGVTSIVPSPENRLLIRTASIVLRVGNAGEMGQSIAKELRTMGVEVSAQSLNKPSAGATVIRFTLRVKEDQFEPVLEKLQTMGDLESLDRNTQDVTEEFVDHSLRLENQRRLRQRLLDLLKNRAGKLSEVMEVEKELSTISEEMERIQGRMRYLKDRSARSTIQVALLEPEAHIGRPNRSIFHTLLQSLVDGAYLFIDTIALGVRALGALLPPAIILWVVYILRKRIRRRGEKTASGVRPD